MSGAGVAHYHLLHRPRSVPTALGPAPLVTYPHRPSQAGGYPRECALPPPPLPGGALQGGRGIPGGKDRRGERKGDGRMKSDREEREKKKKTSRSGSRTHCRSVLNQLSVSYSRCHAMVLDFFGGRLDAPPPPGGRQWLLQSRAAGSESPVPCSSPQPGGWQQAPAHWRTAPTPPLPLGRQPPLLVPGARQRAFRPTCSSIAPAPPPRTATGGLRFFLLPDLLSTAIPLSSEGSLTVCPSFLPGFGTNVMKLVDTGRRRQEPANI